MSALIKDLLEYSRLGVQGGTRAAVEKRARTLGYELLLDPTSPIIVGVFPVRPVQRA